MEPGRELLAAGAFDGHVRVYSTTDNAIKIGAVMPCHTAPVSQVAWSPTNNNHLVTAGLCDQQNLRIWDIRRLALSLSLLCLLLLIVFGLSCCGLPLCSDFLLFFFFL